MSDIADEKANQLAVFSEMNIEKVFTDSIESFTD